MSDYDSGTQWDLPFGWAPTSWLAIKGLDRYGFTADGHQITLELKNGEKLGLEFGGETPPASQYAAVNLDGQLWVFEFPLKLYRDVVGCLVIP